MNERTKKKKHQSITTAIQARQTYRDATTTKTGALQIAHKHYQEKQTSTCVLPCPSPRAHTHRHTDTRTNINIHTYVIQSSGQIRPRPHALDPHAPSVCLFCFFLLAYFSTISCLPSFTNPPTKNSLVFVFYHYLYIHMF